MEPVTESASITTSPPPLAPSAALAPQGSAPPARPAQVVNRTPAAAAVATPTLSFSCSEERGEFLGALARAQLQFTQVEKAHTAEVRSKKGEGSSYEYDYEDLEDVIRAVRPALNGEGIALMQFPQTRQGSLLITTYLGHKSGQFFCNDLVMPGVNLTDVQAMASALTYGKRYALKSMLGISAGEKDDDGRRALPPETDRQPAPVQTVPMPQRQPAAPCSECNGTGKLTRLGGDLGKTPDTEVPCWKCQPSNKPVAKKLTIARLQKKESGNGSPYWAVELSDKQQALTFDVKKGAALEDGKVRGDAVTKFTTRKQGSYTHIEILEIDGVRS